LRGLRPKGLWLCHPSSPSPARRRRQTHPNHCRLRTHRLKRKGCRSSLGCETTESSSGGEKLPWMNSVLQVCPDRVSLCLFLSITFTQGTKDLFSFIYTLHKCFTNQSEVLKVKHILIR
uniref:Uncharacterized protein n=1 Tax=Gasterosteus aculeatus TaxID=69293 RepID=G3NP03_GASAC